MIRRDFLRIAGAAPLIVGLDDLFAAQDAVPAWYADALKRAKATGRSLLVFVVPKDEAERVEWAQDLLALVDSDDLDVREVLAEAVVVCVTPEIAAKTVRAEGSKDNRFLLGSDGKPVSSSTIDAGALESAAFVKQSRELLHGKDDDRLKSAADAILKNAPDSVKAALDKLASDSIDVRDEARGVLLAKADSIMPLLVRTRMTTKNADVAGAIRQIVKDWTSTERAPAGTRLSGTKGLVPPRDPCPTCGKAVIAPQARRVLEFLVK